MAWGLCVLRCVHYFIRRVRSFPCLSVLLNYFIYFINWLFRSMENIKRSVGGANFKPEVDPEAQERLFMERRDPYAMIDMQNFRQKAEEAFEVLQDMTDTVMDDEENLPNVEFYRNNKPFAPEGILIEDFHSNWLGNYDRLEYVHTYIQWLFPIQEKGMNYESQELNLKEIKLFHQDPMIKKRMLVSYKLMLNFYGIKLLDDETGAVTHAENWSHRFDNLNRNSHNNLRITRILKCLGLLGFGHYQAPLVHFFLEETLRHNRLPRVKQSVLDYFIFAVLDKTKQKELIQFACLCESNREFVECPNPTEVHNRKETARNLSKGWSCDTNSQSHQIDSRVQNEEEIELNDMTYDNVLVFENVSGMCQESDTQILLPIHANTADINKDTEAPPYITLQNEALVQEEDWKTEINEISNTERFSTSGNDNDSLSELSKDQSDRKNVNESRNKNLQTSDLSITQKVANKSGSSGIEQQDRANKSDPGSNNELINTTKQSKEETQQRDDTMATGSSANNEGISAERKSPNYIESDKNVNKQSITEENEMIKDPVNGGLSMEDNPRDRLPDVYYNNVTSNSATNADSKDVKDGDITSGNSPQGSHGDDSEQGKKRAVTEEVGLVQLEEVEKYGNE